MFNNDAEYAASRLTNSYVKAKNYEQGLIRVTKVVYEGSTRFNDAMVRGDDKNLNQVSVRATDFEFSPGRLGYVNYLGRGTWYVTRMPIRRDYKQGLRANQLSINKLGNNDTTPVRDGELESVDFRRALTDCLFDKYPSLDNTLDLIEDTGQPIAFSKHFSVSEDFQLFYKGLKVGGITGNGGLKLGDRFQFLTEELAKEAGDDKLAR